MDGIYFRDRSAPSQIGRSDRTATVLGNVAPVPGGIGVQEAALTAGLTGFGIPSAAALATVLVFRAVTFVIPPIFGFFTLRWLRNHDYA